MYNWSTCSEEKEFPQPEEKRSVFNIVEIQIFLFLGNIIIVSFILKIKADILGKINKSIVRKIFTIKFFRFVIKGKNFHFSSWRNNFATVIEAGDPDGGKHRMKFKDNKMKIIIIMKK